MEAQDSSSDARWVNAIQQGDEDAFSAMVRAYYTGLFDFAYSFTRMPDVAEDLVQNILLNVWEGRRTWQPQGTARAYLYRAVRNRALNVLRDQGRHRQDDLAHAATKPEAAPGPEEDLLYQELVADYHAAVEALPERRRLVFRLSRLYGLTYEEIGTVMDVSVNTVRTQMTAALKHLRERLAGHMGA